MKSKSRIFTAFLIFNISIQVFSFNLNIHDPSTFIARSLCECKHKCIQDPDCVLSYWKPLNDVFLCKNQLDRSIPFVASPDVHFHCRDCLMTRDELDQGVKSGAIQWFNVALNKNTDASSVYINNGEHLKSKQAVDGVLSTRYASGSEETTINSKEWLMIDLAKQYRLYQIKITGILVDRHGYLKIFLSPTFNEAEDFSTYPEILDVPGNSISNAVTYNISAVNTGRYVVVERQKLTGYLDISEIQLYTANVRVI